MNKAIITNAVISKGYEDKPSLNYSEKRDCVRFKVGYKVYDKREETNQRWVNLHVKAFNPFVERIEKMGLKEGSYVNLIGKLDEDVWDDNGTKKRMTVITLDEIEYAGVNPDGKKQESGGTETPPEAPAGNGQNTPAADEGSGEFTGFQTFGGDNNLY